VPRDEPFDAEQFVAKLQRATEEHARVVARRPTGEKLADALSEAARLLYEWTDAARLKACDARGIDPRQSYAWAPLDGSVAHSDHAETEPGIAKFCAGTKLTASYWLDTNPIRNPTTWAIDYLTRCFHTVIDDLAGIADLVKQSERLRAPITLSRSVMEAGATGCFIADTTVDTHERLRRSLNLHLAEVKEASNERRGTPDRDPLEIELQELMSFAQDSGFALDRYRPNDILPPRIRPDSGRHDSASSIIDRVLPGIGTTMWRSMSAVAHARDSQFLIPDAYGLPHELKPWQRVESVAWHTLPSVLVVRELGQHLERYLGWSFEPFSSLWDAVAMHWSRAAGLDDKRIRAELGLDPV
jgi:hypothetical protein